MADEIVDIVDEQDNVLYQLERKEAYRQKLRCRVTHCFLIDRQTGQFVMMIRSRNASFRPLHHALFGGFLQSGETSEQGMRRELREEAGIEPPLQFIGKYLFTDPSNDQVFVDNVFVAMIDAADVVIDPVDIEETAIMSFKALSAMVTATDSQLHPLLPGQVALLLEQCPELLTQ